MPRSHTVRTYGNVSLNNNSPAVLGLLLVIQLHLQVYGICLNLRKYSNRFRAKFIMHNWCRKTMIVRDLQFLFQKKIFYDDDYDYRTPAGLDSKNTIYFNVSIPIIRSRRPYISNQHFNNIQLFVSECQMAALIMLSKRDSYIY